MLQRKEETKKERETKKDLKNGIKRKIVEETNKAQKRLPVHSRVHIARTHVT